MAVKPSHVDWLRDTGRRVKTASGHEVEIWSFDHATDPALLSAWATHFRQQYIDDAQLPAMVAGTGRSHAEYLRDVIFPDGKAAPGPSTRSGDFAEILVADYIEFVLGYWCPRDRYKGRFQRNDSTKGADIVGFRFVADGGVNAADELFVVEAKSGMTATAANRLQDAVTDSLKDALREAMTLNALKQRMLDRGRWSPSVEYSAFRTRPISRSFASMALLPFWTTRSWPRPI